MNTKNMTEEQISALVDNELADEHVESLLAALRRADGRAAWDVYHQIGDVMRSEDMAQVFSADFADRLTARLDAEPTVIAPMIAPIPERQSMQAAGGAGARRVVNASFKRYAIPSAAVAVAAIALIANPQFMVAIKGGVHSDTMAPIMVVSKTRVDSPQEKLASGSSQQLNRGVAVQDGVILRDPRIDEYLLAHQRFSPSLYSSAQYARSATFASDPDK